MNKRNIYFDIAKGIGIFLVIAGHMPNFIPWWIKGWIDSFHMPLFIFCAGYFAKPLISKTEMPNRIMKVIRRILLPYVIYSLVFTLCYFFYYQDFDFLKDSMIKLLCGYGSYYPLWFLFSLATIEIVFIVVEYFAKNKIQLILSTTFLVVIGFAFRYIDGTNMFVFGSSLYGFGFYVIGYLIKKNKLISSLFRLKNFIYAIFISIFTTAILIILSGNTMEMISNKQFDIVLNYISALSGIVITLNVSKCVLKYKIISDITSHIGRNSLYYYPFTAFIPDYCKVLFGDEKLIKILSRVISFPLTFLILKFQKGNIQNINYERKK